MNSKGEQIAGPAIFYLSAISVSRGWYQIVIPTDEESLKVKRNWTPQDVLIEISSRLNVLLGIRNIERPRIENEATVDLLVIRNLEVDDFPAERQPRLISVPAAAG
jgi:hypothetical protein